MIGVIQCSVIPLGAADSLDLIDAAASSGIVGVAVHDGVHVRAAAEVWTYNPKDFLRFGAALSAAAVEP